MPKGHDREVSIDLLDKDCILHSAATGRRHGHPAFAQNTKPSDGGGKLITITIENVLTDQPFSPTVVESRTADAAVLFKLGDKASEELIAVAEGGNTGMYALAAAMNKDSTIGDAQLAIHTLPGQKRTFFVRVDETHPLVDGVWMLGNTMTAFPALPGSMLSA